MLRLSVVLLDGLQEQPPDGMALWKQMEKLLISLPHKSGSEHQSCSVAGSEVQ